MAFRRQQTSCAAAVQVALLAAFFIIMAMSAAIGVEYWHDFALPDERLW